MLGMSSVVFATKVVNSQEATVFLPVPTWQPSFFPEIEEVSERFGYYTNNKRDFVIFQNSTCCMVPLGLTDVDARIAAIEVLTKVFNYHPDMNPLTMDDGNILVRYNEPAYNVVLAELAQRNWTEIESRYQDGLTPHEVLITPLGQNIFDEMGKMALLGRCWMFMDAQSPKVAKIVRVRT